MSPPSIVLGRVRHLLTAARKTRILVVGDAMLDQFVWGNVSRISPEAPVPIVDFVRESYMPGGAANVARNLSALGVQTSLFGVLGKDDAGRRLRELLRQQNVDCRGLLSDAARTTSIKTRIVAQKQQMVRVDRETRGEMEAGMTRRLLAAIEPSVMTADALIVGDYGKGVVTQGLLDGLKHCCRARGVWLSVDPKPVHRLDLCGLSLLTPNRKEAFELAELPDDSRAVGPLEHSALSNAANKLLAALKPALLLITLGDQGMLLCQRGCPPVHIPTVAREVFDVSGAGDTVIASFTMAIAAGASPFEAAVISNHAAGVVVGKIGTATADASEVMASFGG